MFLLSSRESFSGLVNPSDQVLLESFGSLLPVDGRSGEPVFVLELTKKLSFDSAL